ncbi:MAG: prolyl aminopeptidase [Gammaproteobacteria bacterium]|nr:prolyl aminopeptidase [Gammaproteobacteria bacterium]MDE2345005.1 prolyl aminopeptidase [Gammaproteobacteria bacterium]
MRELFPPLEPYATRKLQVQAPHELYVEECGNPHGVPVVFVHGGPGGGCTPDNRRFFDPARYRIVLFDQRGCGRSRPHAELVHNTTQALVEDMERIRDALGIERWLVFGGSWGSTLSLVYAESHPQRVLGLILRGIFLVTAAELNWFYQDGIQHVFPDHFEDFVTPIPEAERADLIHAYYKRLTSDDPDTRRHAAEVWSLFEARCSTLLPSASVVDHFSDPDVAMAIARIECHYFVHDCFLAPDQIIRDASVIRDIPGVIVQGRYDMVCPAIAAWQLHKAWPKAQFRLVPDAGHASSEPGICSALVEATDEFAGLLSVR